MRLVRTALKERIDHLTQLILTSATVQPAAPSATSPIQTQPQQTNGFSGRDDPWVLVRELRREVQELKLQNEQLRRQVRAQEDELDAISSQKSDHQALVDKVAQLEAELSVTKAELEVTSMMAKEVAHDSRKPPSSPPVSSPKIKSLVTDMSTI
ncbi:hypothetical protein BC940DRAFT_54175 [Gongronella butleri]|nr:hypothetical protein BC940DRAFT_54175 [Gongronella butleri]